MILIKSILKIHHIFFLLLFLLSISSLKPQGDTVSLLQGSETISTCLKNNIFTNCSQLGYTSHFPMVQYLISVPLLLLKFSPETILLLIQLLNFISLIVILYIFSIYFSENYKYYLHWIILLTSPLLWYSQTTFAELFTALIILLFTITCYSYKNNLFHIFLLFIFAGLTKETSPPFLLVIGLVSLNSLKNYRKLLVLGAATIIAIIINFCFNYFRFGTFMNTTLTSDRLIVSDFFVQTNFFLGLLFSPNGGLLFFWTSFLMFVFFLLKKILSEKENTLPFLGLIFMLLGLVLGFSKWFSPFGWVAWGPRLLLPWIPSILFALAWKYKMFSYAINSKLYYLFLLVALPQFLVLIYPNFINAFFEPTALCPTPVDINVDLNKYYFCTIEKIWLLRFDLFRTYKTLLTWQSVAMTTIFLLTMNHLMQYYNKYNNK